MVEKNVLKSMQVTWFVHSTYVMATRYFQLTKRADVCIVTFIMLILSHIVNALTIPCFQHFAKLWNEIVIRVGIVIRLQQSEIYGITNVSSVQEILDKLLHLHVDVPKGV